MKSKLKILVLNYLLVFWGSFKYNKKTSKIIGSSIAIVIGGLVFMVLMGITAFGQMTIYAQIGMPEAGFYYFLVLAFLLAILMAVMRSSTNNNATDADMLLSMPLPRQTIMLAKSLSKYLFELLPITVFFLPSVIVYIFVAGPGLLTILRCLLVWLMIPLLSVGISYLLGWLFFKISDKLKNPSAITTVLSMLVIFGFVTFNLSSGSSENTADMLAHYASLKPLNWALDFMIKGSLLDFFYFALITVGPFILGLLVNARIFGVQHKTWTSKKQDIDYRSRSPRQTLIKKELIRFFGSSGYMMNAGIGMVMSLLMTIVVVIGNNSFLANFLHGESMEAILPALLIIAYCCCAGMSYMSACMISLEGKQLWILKTLPVNINDVFQAKINANLFVTLPLTLLGVIVSSLVLGISLLEMALMAITCGVFCVMAANIGLVLNLTFPKLDWKEEIQVVKQGTSVILALFVGTLPIIAVFVVYLVFLSSIISFAIYSLLAIALFVFITGFCQKWLAKRGRMIFSRL